MAAHDFLHTNFQILVKKEIFEQIPDVRWHEALPETEEGCDDYIIDGASVSLKYSELDPGIDMGRELVLMVKEHIEKEKCKPNGFRDFCNFHFVLFTQIAGNFHSRELDRIFCYFYQFRKINL